LELESVSIMDQIMATQHGARDHDLDGLLVMCSEKVAEAAALFFCHYSGLVIGSLQLQEENSEGLLLPLRGPIATICCLRYRQHRVAWLLRSTCILSECLAFVFQEFQFKGTLKNRHPAEAAKSDSSPDNS